VELILCNKRNKSLRIKGTNNYTLGNKRTSPGIRKNNQDTKIVELILWNKRNKSFRTKEKKSLYTKGQKKDIPTTFKNKANFMEQEEHIFYASKII
jgi:hypothetical protein